MLDTNLLESETFALKEASGLNTLINAYITPDSKNYLDGANKRFYQQHGFQRGIEILYTVPYHPVVASSFLKLTQEVEVSQPKVIPSGSLNRILAQIHAKYIEEKFAELNVAQFFSDLLLAYITGVVAHELVWKQDTAGKGTIHKINAIPVDYLLADSSGLFFRKSVNSNERVLEGPLKFSKFTYSQFLDVSPLGDGVGKTIFYLLQERERIECLAKAFALRGASPTIVVKATGNVKASAVRSVIDNISRNESWKAIALPPGLDLTSLPASGDYKIYEYLLGSIDTTIAQLLAGETIVGSASGNSQRGSAEASNLRKTRAARLAQKALQHINRVIVRPLIDVKFGQQKSYPEFVYPMPRVSLNGKATITEAIQLQSQLGLEIKPSWFETEFSVDLKDVLADG